MFFDRHIFLSTFCRDAEAEILKYTFIFLTLSIATAIIEYSGVAGDTDVIIKALFAVFLVLFVVSAIAKAVKCEKPKEII